MTPPEVSLRSLAKLSGPIFVANMAIMGSAIIDTVMAGNLGAEHLAVVALGGATAVMVMFGLVGVLQGLSPVAGHHYGAGKLRLIGFELIQSLWLAFFLAITSILLLRQTDIWIDFGGAKGNVALMTADYLKSCSWGIAAAVLSRAFVAVNAAVSRPRVTMYVSLISLALKAPMNLVFMYGWLGFPAMGGAGAGLAMSFNCILSLIAYVVIFQKDKFYDPMRPEKFYAPDFKALWAQLKLGIPIGLSMFFEVSSFTLMAIFISRIGTTDVAAHQIVSNLTATLYQIPLSIAIAVCVLVSQSLGARCAATARIVTLRGLKVALCIACCSVTLLVFFNREILSLYTHDEAVLALAASLLIFGMIYHTADAAQTVSNFALRGYRVTLAPMIIYGVMLWAVGLGVGSWLAFDGGPAGAPMGAVGFWMAMSVGLVLAGIALTILVLYVSGTRKHEAQQASRHATAH